MSIFAAPGDQARSTPVWAAFILLWVFWLVANIVALPAIMLVMAPALLAGQGVAPSQMGLTIILTLYLMFSAFAACVLIWIKVYERRSLASAGLIRRGSVGRYFGGLFWGLIFALALVLLAVMTVGLVPEEEASGPFSWAVFSRPETLLVFAALIFGLFVQSAAEEIICRGWVMSSLAMRHGRTAGLVLSALFFGSLHVHFLFTGNLLAGLVAMAAVTLMGLMLGLYALNQRSLAGAAGMHGAFNATVFAVTLAAILGTGETTDPLAGLNTAYELSTQPLTLSAESFVQGALALGVSLFLWSRLRRKEG
jgi:membrane protease YdiL (CAAX protease family)